MNRWERMGLSANLYATSQTTSGNDRAAPASVPASGALQQLVGCDFSSAPSHRKPIVLAWGAVVKGRVSLSRLQRIESLDGYDDWLRQPEGWLGAFDFPFSLPRELVTQLGWPLSWPELLRHYASLSRAEIRDTFAAFCDARPVGGKFAHRASDGPAGASPSMKWVNPPVAYMLHAGAPRLLDAGVHLPGLHAGDLSRVALEGYPGLLAREVLGQRSYKSDDRQKQTPERLIARKDLITALEMGQTRLGLRLKLTHAQRDALVDDASGDSLDATLCLMQAAWAQARHAEGASNYGLPDGLDPLEGWIITAEQPSRFQRFAVAAMTGCRVIVLAGDVLIRYIFNSNKVALNGRKRAI